MPFMMTSEPEFEPDFTGVSHLESFEKDSEGLVLNFGDDEFLSSLESVASNLSLGDTNMVVTGQIKGKLEAYKEANASSAL